MIINGFFRASPRRLDVERNRLNLSPAGLSHGHWMPFILPFTPPLTLWRTTMSRKITLSLVAAATVAVATFASQSADARGFAGGFGGARGVGGGRVAMTSFTGHRTNNGGRLTPIFPRNPGGGHPSNPGRPGYPGHWVFHHHDHGHWVLRDGRWIVIDDVVEEAPAPIVTAPGPCTCLTKNYTPSGLVVFADVCTKESASASVDGGADATQVPTTPVAATAVPMAVVPTNPNYAGRTYEDYLAANPQAAQQQPAPQKN
jgi:hypothetical protein